MIRKRSGPGYSCSKCGATDPTLFYPSAKPGGSYCRKCHRAYYKQKVAEDNRYFLRYQNRWRRRTADLMCNLRAERGCAMCGEKHPACLDFHHRDATDKKFTIAREAGTRKKSIEALLAEAEKCDVLCANCHRKIHWAEWQEGRERHRQMKDKD